MAIETLVDAAVVLDLHFATVANYSPATAQGMDVAVDFRVRGECEADVRLFPATPAQADMLKRCAFPMDNTKRPARMRLVITVESDDADPT